MATRRLNVSLDDADAARLTRLAQRTRVQEGTLARSLLAQALEDADPDARTMTEVLESIPGAFERAQAGRAEARAGKTVPLDEL